MKRLLLFFAILSTILTMGVPHSVNRVIQRKRTIGSRRKMIQDQKTGRLIKLKKLRAEAPIRQNKIAFRHQMIRKKTNKKNLVSRKSKYIPRQTRMRKIMNNQKTYLHKRIKPTNRKMTKHNYISPTQSHLAWNTRPHRSLEDGSPDPSIEPGEELRPSLDDLNTDFEKKEVGEDLAINQDDEDGAESENASGKAAEGSNNAEVESIEIEPTGDVSATGKEEDRIRIDEDEIKDESAVIPEEEDLGDGTKLEDRIVGIQLSKMQRTLDIYKDLIINCIDQRYSTNMFMDQILVRKACLGFNYEILTRTYHENIERTQRIFMKIFRHKLTGFKEEWREEVLIFCNMVRLLVLKDLHLSESLAAAQEKIKYMMNPGLYRRILIDIGEEIAAYDEMRDQMIASKDAIHDHLEMREEEKEAAKKKLAEEEGVLDEEEMSNGSTRGSGASIEMGSREKGEWDSKENEDQTNLEDLEESELEEQEEPEDEDDTSRVPPDDRDEYDPSAASVGPGAPSEESSMDSSLQRKELNGSESTISQEHKVDRPVGR